MRVAESSRARTWRTGIKVLQWGRNMRVAESKEQVRAGKKSLASMGPQHESCGKVALVAKPAYGEKLQWGRNMRVAESCKGACAPGGRMSSFNGAAT